jgi:hypothetical protein
VSNCSILLDSEAFCKHSRTVRRLEQSFVTLHQIYTKFLSMTCELRIIVA